MVASEIHLINFKNYVDQRISLCEGINCILGPNGSGKTNFLDAIHFLALTKSAFSTPDKGAIRHDESFYSLKGTFFEGESESFEVFTAFQNGRKKTFKYDGHEYEKLRDHIGKLPLVMISPFDQQIILGGSEDRRRLVDSVLCQVNQRYLNALTKYNSLIKYRNAFLKQSSLSSYDKDLITIHDNTIIELAIEVAQVRHEFIQNAMPSLTNYYTDIGGQEKKEIISVIYDTTVNQSGFRNQFENTFEKDLLLQRTTLGVHKDDFSFLLNEYPLKKIGSQGQQKTFLLAIKLALFKFIKDSVGMTPLLLLDDIFDKLDDNRIEKLLALILSDDFGQIILTDARPERTKRILDNQSVIKKYITIIDAQVLPEQV